MLYKVLVNGDACHGGTFAYDLPVGITAGAWTPTIDEVKVCESGYHLTTDPFRWYVPNADVWRAEGRGENSAEDDKIAFASVRLLAKDYRISEAFAKIQGIPKALETVIDREPKITFFPNREHHNNFYDTRNAYMPRGHEIHTISYALYRRVHGDQYRNASVSLSEQILSIMSIIIHRAVIDSGTLTAYTWARIEYLLGLLAWASKNTQLSDYAQILFHADDFSRVHIVHVRS